MLNFAYIASQSVLGVSFVIIVKVADIEAVRVMFFESFFGLALKNTEVPGHQQKGFIEGI